MFPFRKQYWLKKFSLILYCIRCKLVLNRLFTWFCFSFSGVFLEVAMRLPCSCHALPRSCHALPCSCHAPPCSCQSPHAVMCSKSVQASLIKTALREQTKTVQWCEKMRITLYCTEKTCSCIYPSVSRNVKGTIKRGKKFFLQLKSI
jgi:hypothetical protein